MAPLFRLIFFSALILFGFAAPAELIRDVEYARPDGVSLKLDVNVPEGKGPFPMVILVHGGGFTNVNRQESFAPLLPSLTEAKFTWLNINYRGLASGSYPMWVEDVQRAIRWAKAHGAEYKGDTNRVALIGESFGGYLTWLAVGRATNDDTKVQAAVVFYGPFLDMEAIAKKNGHIPAQQRKVYGIPDDAGMADILPILHEASAPTYVRPGLPPFLLVHGTADEKAPYKFSVEAQKRLTAAGVPCELISETNGLHGMVNWTNCDQGYKAKTVDWLNTTLGREN